MLGESNLVADYVRASIQLAERRLRILAEEQGKPLGFRDTFGELRGFVSGFVAGESTRRIIVMPGLRGTGKSTLLAQLYLHLRGQGIPAERVLYLSLDELRIQTGKGLLEALEAYQNRLGMTFTEVDGGAPVFLLLDEVHHDPQWALALKVLHDKSRWVFAIATGSSSLELNMSADLARRAWTEQVEPLTLSETLILSGKEGAGRFRREIADAVLRSSDAADAFSKLERMRAGVFEIEAKMAPMGLERYLRVGTLPLTLLEHDEAVAFQMAFGIERKVVMNDMATVKGFDQATLIKALNLLAQMAFSDRMSHESMIKSLDTNKHTLAEMLFALESTDLVHVLRPYGSVGGRFRKTPKYKFAAPIFRAAHMWALGRPLDSGESLGLLFEDVVAMYLHKMSKKVPIIDACFDPHEGGADFIITPGANRPIAMEVSYGRKGTEQLIASANNYGVSYGVLVSNSDLELVEKENIVKVPREWFLLSA